MRRFGTRAAAALLTLGLATAGFAGIASAGELSKKEYKAEINDLCSDAADEIDAVFEEVFAGVDEGDPAAEDAAFEAAIEGALPIFRQMLDDIEELEGPAKFEKKVAKLVDQYRDAADEIEADPLGILYEDAPDPFAKPDKRAKKLGLKECAQD